MPSYYWIIAGLWFVDSIFFAVWGVNWIDIKRHGPKCRRCQTRLTDSICSNCYQKCVGCGHPRQQHNYDSDDSAFNCYCGCEAFTTQPDYHLAVAKLGEDYFA